MATSILVPVDGSHASNAAANLALRLAVKHQATVHALVMVETEAILNPDAHPASDPAPDLALDLKPVGDHGQRADAVLEEFASRARGAGVPFSGTTIQGAPLPAITSAATSCDLIVVGKTSLRSVSGEMTSIPLCIELLLRTSVRPTLVVPDLKVVGEPEVELAPIVVAFDGSVVSSRALHLFALLGLGRDRQVHLLTQDDESTARAEATAEAGCALLRAHGLKQVRPIALGNRHAGTPSETILGVVKSVDASMVVMGAYGQRGIFRWEGEGGIWMNRSESRNWATGR